MIERRRERPEALRNSFATVDRRRGITEVLCRVCGVVIGKPIAVGAQRIRKVKNQTFVETDMQFCYLANYREIDIRMEDGGRHVANACVECAPKVAADKGLLERFCETDLKQWRSEGATITAQMDRRPSHVTKIADAIVE